MIKVTFVGAGWFANWVHGPSLAHYAKEHPEEIELAAVCVRKSVDRAKEFCEKFGFKRIYTDVDEMIDTERPDACWSITGIESTRQVAGHLMEREVPVFFEKPPGGNLREAEELAEISRRTGTPNMVAFNRRWAPCTRKALSLAKENGPIEYIYARMLRTDRTDRAFSFGTGIHLLDCVRHLALETVGEITEARTLRTLSAVKRVRTESGEEKAVVGEADSDSQVFNFYVDLKFASGARGRCDILPVCGALDESYTLFGALKSVTCTLPWTAGKVNTDGKAELLVNGEAEESETYAFDPIYLSGGFYGEASEFIGALKEGRKPSPSVEETIASVALAEAVQEGRDIRF